MLLIKYQRLSIQRETKFEKAKNLLNIHFGKNQLLRSRMRHDNLKELECDGSHPKLLRNESQFTKLLLIHSHGNVYHNSVYTTFNFEQIVKSIIARWSCSSTKETILIIFYTRLKSLALTMLGQFILNAVIILILKIRNCWLHQEY